MLRLSEVVATRPDVTHRLARTLFDGLFTARWITEGYAGWAEHEAGVSDAPCTAPATHPGSDEPFLARWVELSRTPTPDGLALEAWQRQASCHIVSTLADAIGPDAMRATVAMIRDGRSAYPTDAATAEVETAAATTTDHPAVDWRDWLDVVEEQGLVVAGTDATELTKLLLAYGVTGDADALATRAATLDAYHEMLATTGGVAPLAVTAPLAEWSYADATAAIDATVSAWETTEPSAPPWTAPRSTTVRSDTPCPPPRHRRIWTPPPRSRTTNWPWPRWSPVRSRSKRAPRDLVQEVGLAGTSLPAAETGIAAVEGIDAAGAAAFESQVATTIGSARDTGTQRLAIGIGGILALLLALVGAGLLIRRRRRRATPAVSVGPPTDD